MALKLMRRSFLFAFLTLVGMTVGAGVFALPSLFARFGVWQASLCFWFLAAFVIAVQRLYVDVILSVPTSHRLPGYARLALGKRWGVLATATHFLPMYGAQVIYLLLGSVFLQALLARFGWPVPQRVAMLAVFTFIAAAVWGGLRRVARLDAALVAINLFLFVLTIVAAASHAPAPTQFMPQPSWEAFGLVLFALSALSIVPEVTELCERRKRPAHLVVVLGTGLAALVIWAFAFVLARAGGTQLTAQPQSLLVALPPWGAAVLPLMGLLAISTAYLASAEALQGSWQHDYRFRTLSSWLVTLFPAVLVALLLKDGFVLLATILGTVCGGINGVLIGMMRVAIAERKREALALAFGLAAIFVYGFGVSGQIVTWLFL